MTKPKDTTLQCTCYNNFIDNSKKGGYPVKQDSPLINEKRMCKQETALKMLQSMPKKGGMTKSMEAMFMAQIEDTIETKKELKAINSKICDIEKVQKENSEKIDLIIQMHRRPSILKTIQAVLSNKVFIYILITLFCAAFGVSTGGVGTFLFKQ